jgi:hypothetical protein
MPNERIFKLPHLQGWKREKETKPLPPKDEVKIVAPVYEGYVSILDYGMRVTVGMTVKFALEPGAEIHPFKGLVARPTGGHRLRLIISVLNGDEEPYNIYSGESMLVAWAEDHRIGMSVKFRLDDGPDGYTEHPLKDMGKGERVYIACWAVSEDEDLQDPREARKSSRVFSNIGPAQQSQIKCRLDRDFQKWCRDFARLKLDPNIDLPDFEFGPAEYAASVVRAWCGVESRTEFSQDNLHGLNARQAWIKMLRDFDTRDIFAKK